ncbi:PilN domain-containing protein [Indioceanicola profundi]|uniref:PilN domain-containing protein n=1 Tax=Indioceanicola profundi TaxID=2220096 RepID=UPI000E6AA538|nr:PilN domain-containing protein [Indioceanicola profundi]
MVSVGSFLQPAKVAAAWWLSELAGLVPDRLRSLPRQGGRLVLRLGTNGADLLVEGGRESKLAGHITFQEANRASVCKLVVQLNPERECAAHLQLPASSALRTTIQLPIAAETNLQEVIDFEMDRQTPFRPEQVYTASKIVNRDPTNHILTVELTLVLRSLADAAIQRVATMGITPKRIEIARTKGQGADQLEVPSIADRSGKARDRLTLVLGGLAAILAMTALTIPIREAKRAAAAAEREFAEVRATAEAVADVSQKLEALRVEAGYLVRLKNAKPMASDILLEITRLIPDDAWLTELEIASDEIRVSGYARSASGLVGTLEGSSLFRETAFRAPVMLDTKAERERFSLSARIDGAAP